MFAARIDLAGPRPVGLGDGLELEEEIALGGKSAPSCKAAMSHRDSVDCAHLASSEHQ
jgi:hypothetical protein